MDKHYRHEWKHVLHVGDLLILRQRLSAVMDRDPHTINGKYHIRSLYFDNLYDKALREKIDGISMREKFRLRLYNGDASIIHLEKKSKWNNLGTKYCANLTEEEALKLTVGDFDWMLASDDSLIQELYCKIRYQGIRPKTIVDYIREPFILEPGNVRVTLDYDIRTGLNCTDFLNSSAVTIPAGDAPIILEVKWDEFIPSIIQDVVCVPNRRVGSFSKYCQCRVYG